MKRSHTQSAPVPLLAMRRRRTLLITGVIGLILIGALISARPIYRSGRAWRARGLAAEAEQLRQAKDLRGAASKAQAALNLDPEQAAVLRAAARLNSLARGGNAGTFWRQLVRHPEATAEDRRTAALHALATNQHGFAEEQIIGMLKAVPDDLGALELAVQLALKKNEPLAALAFSERLLAKNPEHPFGRLNRAQILLLSPDLSKAAPAPSPLCDFEATLPAVARPRNTREELRAEVRKLADDAERRVEAFRLLILEARRRGALDQAVDSVRELLSGPGWSFEDQLVQLDLLAESKSPELESAVANLLRSATQHESSTAMLGTWLLEHGRPGQVLDALQLVSREARDTEGFKLLHADACAALERWGEAEAILQKPWQKLDLHRRAALARAVRAQGRATEFQAAWRDLVEAYKGKRVELLHLLKVCGVWQWRAEQEQLLQIMLKRFPEEKWVPSVLTKLYLDSGRSQELRALYEQLLQNDPRNAELKNNVAILSLLMANQQEKAVELAREAYEASPRNPSYTCTYAYALHSQGRRTEALRLMRSLPEEALRRPNTATYYSVMLRDSGDNHTAGKYAALASAGRLLPEERAMLQPQLESHLQSELNKALEPR
ncbi:MAG: hypothetical protein JWQ44_879 [Chthoniobacter sp.]|nr:hypothetical protein [Chthoniobacter sp.]